MGVARRIFPEWTNQLHEKVSDGNNVKLLCNITSLWCVMYFV